MGEGENKERRARDAFRKRHGEKLQETTHTQRESAMVLTENSSRRLENHMVRSWCRRERVRGKVEPT